MMEVLPDVDVSYDKTKPLRLAAVVHLFYEEMTDELMDRLVMLPEKFDLFITTTDQDKADAIRAILDRRADEKVAHCEIRILPSNRGRDLSAFFIACRDVLDAGSLRPRREDPLQEDRPGLVQPRPVLQVSAARQRAAQRGLRGERGRALPEGTRTRTGLPPDDPHRVPDDGARLVRQQSTRREARAKNWESRFRFDEISPLAPYGCFWFARPEALRILVDHEWKYEDYAAPDKHSDGSLAHVQERLIAYAAAELGYHARTISTTEHAAISHAALDFKLDQMGATMPGYPIDQIQFLHRAGWLVTAESSR